LKLYRRLEEMRCCMVLGSNTQLLYALQPEPLLDILDWGAYLQLFRSLNIQQRYDMYYL
jgi:hypothetical protein